MKFDVKGDKMEKINLLEKFSKFTEYWQPKVITEMNDYQFKLVKINGDFVWHNHPDTDETFIVIKGEMKIQFESEIIELEEGEMIVVPKGTEHKPYAKKKCHIMLVEPKGVINTGSTKVGLTAPNDIWI